MLEPSADAGSAGRHADLRLLPAAGCAWVVTAATLAVPSRWRLAGAFALALVGGLTVLPRPGGLRRPGASSGPRRRWCRRGGNGPGHRLVPSPALAVRAAVGLALAATSVCLAAAGLHDQVRSAGTVSSLAQRGATVLLTARVVSDPRTVRTHGPAPQDLVLVRLAVSSVEGRGARSGVSTRVLAFADERWARVRWGQTVVANGRLAPAGAGSDVVATLTARGPPTVTRAAPLGARVAERLRQGLRRSCARLPADARGLLPGLVVGDTSQQPDDLSTAFQATGLTHLCAVSGTNVTIVCVLALALARSVGLGRRTRLVAAAVVLLGFVVLARPEPSVLRAAVMGLIGLLALGTSRRQAGVPALSTAVLVLLLVDPWLARSYGFALSALATLGLLLWARPWGEALARWLPHPLALAVSVPLAAQAACGPVVVLLSGQVSLVSLPANLLAEPMVAPATVLGLAAALVSLLSPPVASWLAWLGGLPCTAIAWTARRLASVPGGQLSWPGGWPGALALALLTVVAVAAGPWLLRSSCRRPWAALAIVLLVGTACLPPAGRHWPPAGWVAVACDVGQGDGLVLRTGDHQAVLVDAGPDPAAIDRCLRRLGVTTVDAVVLTHFHADHVEGLPGALRGRRVGQLLVTLVDDPPAEARRVRTWAAEAHVPVRTARVGDDVTVGPVHWRVLWPTRVVHDGSVPNNASIVLRVDAAGVRLLLLGDVEPAAARLVDRALRDLPDGPRADVVKVAHHGSALQDPGLLRDASPRLALISVGEHNDYGHPAASTLALLRSVGAVVARTDQQADVAVVVRGGRLSWAARR